MATQSRAPVILLTRPAERSARFAQMLLRRFPDATIVMSPLLTPRFLSPQVPKCDWTAVIFTSETAIEAAKRIAADGTPLPTRAFCVGTQTALAAKAAGFDTMSAEGDAEALLSLIKAQDLPGPMLHLHGRETRGDIAQKLENAGIKARGLVVYSQDLHPLSVEATSLLHIPALVLAPIFSPRSAAALADECTRIAAKAPMAIVAISPAAAAAFPSDDVTVAAHPDASSMIAAIASRLKSQGDA